MSLQDHPTVLAYLGRAASSPSPDILDAAELKELALSCGVHDAGLVEIDRPGLDTWREGILRTFPHTRALVGLVVRLNSPNIRCPNRAVADREYSRVMHAVDEAAQRMVEALAEQEVSALYYPAGFPMDMAKWPADMWQVSHKVVAQEAGLGRMGLHRILIHPRWGSHVLLGTVLLDTPVDAYDQPLDWDPCLDCKLCAAACPVGAVGKDGSFNFINCLTHNYRDRLGGFAAWTEQVAASKSAKDYRSRVSDQETVSMWQSLSYGICNKSSYCMAACPAGEELVGPFVDDRAAYIKEVVKPLTGKVENIYVVPGSDAEQHVAKRFPHKTIKRVSNGTRPFSAANFIDALGLLFQPGQAQGIQATYHFTFFGADDSRATVIIKDQTLEVLDGLQGKADLALKADAETWLKFLAKDKALLPALLMGKIKVRGSPKLMKDFARCFPM